MLRPIYSSMSGFILESLGDWKNALTNYSTGGMLIEPDRIMACILQQFKQETISAVLVNEGGQADVTPVRGQSSKEEEFGFQMTAFLSWAYNIGTTVGLQAYRF